MDAIIKNVIVPLVLRLGLAAIFIFHGLEKVKADNDWGSNWMPNGIPAYQQVLVAWGELLAGVAMFLGLLTRVAALGLTIIMAGAIATVHGEKGFSLANGGFEYNFAIIVMCVAVMLLGGGVLAADRLFRFGVKNPTK